MTDLVKNVNSNFLMGQKIKIVSFSFHLPPDHVLLWYVFENPTCINNYVPYPSFINEKFNTKTNRARLCFLQH